MNTHEKNKRRALIIRRASARRRSVAMVVEWERRRSEMRKFEDDPIPQADETESAGSPDHDLDGLPDTFSE